MKVTTLGEHHLAWHKSSVGEPAAGVLVTEFRHDRIVAREVGNRVVVTLNGAHVFTYEDMDAREATARVKDVICVVALDKTPDSHADHWYPRGRDDYAEQYRRWFPKYRRVSLPIPPAGLPDVGDLVEFSDDGESPEHEGPAVVLTVANLGHGVWAWDLHTRAGVLRSVKNTACMRLVRTARMADDAAWWVRENVWTGPMRKTYREIPASFHTCDCQAGPSGHCGAGRHDQCQHRHGPLAPSPEGWITRPDFTVIDEHAGAVWLADRECRWRCPCDCHAGQSAKPSRWAVMPKPKRTKTDVEGQGDLFGLLA